MITSLLLIFVLGCVAGVVTGILPGIGPAHLLAILYFWITGWTPVELVVFYIAYITVSNFVDAIPSLYFGVPGEISAVPASKESTAIAMSGYTHDTIRLAAIGRVVGSVFALALSAVIVQWILEWPQVFSSVTQISFYIFTLFCIMLAGGNSWWRNILLMVAGLAVSAVGYNYYTQQTYATFGWSELYNGLPLLPVLIGVYVIPMLLKNSNVPALKLNPAQSAPGNYVPSMLRGTAVGYFLGLVPGMSFILSSTAAYNFERWWQDRYPSTQDKSVASVVASETASNTGSVSLLIPLLLFGIPIIASEVIIFDLMVDAGAVFALGAFLKTNYITFTMWFVAACCVGFLLSWPLANIFRNVIGRIAGIQFTTVVIVLIMISLMLDAMQGQKIILYFLTLLFSLIAGWALRKHDVMPLVFTFVLGASLQHVIYNIIQLYF
jgi:putative tricarboxylic transport membrane protein